MPAFAGMTDRSDWRNAIRIRPHVERRRGALPPRCAELASARELSQSRFFTSSACGTAPRQGESFSGWLSDLAGRTKNLIEEVDSADLVVMVAAAGERAQAASVICEACSGTR